MSIEPVLKRITLAVGLVICGYGIAGWNLTTRFFSDELYEYASNLDTTERQLRAISNLLHVMGKAVGMDVIPHSERFGEPALGTPVAGGR